MQVCKSVKLRMRDRRNGTKSLFLDFWPGYRDPETMELIRRRSLGLYIYANPTNAQQKQYNEIILSKAEAIRCRVFIDVINEKYDFFNQDRLKEDFLIYFKERQKAHIRSYTADDGCHRWQYWGMGRYATLASQDNAQEIQAWHTSNNDHAGLLSGLSAHNSITRQTDA